MCSGPMLRTQTRTTWIEIWCCHMLLVQNALSHIKTSLQTTPASVSKAAGNLSLRMCSKNPQITYRAVYEKNIKLCWIFNAWLCVGLDLLEFLRFQGIAPMLMSYTKTESSDTFQSNAVRCDWEPWKSRHLNICLEKSAIQWWFSMGKLSRKWTFSFGCVINGNYL